MTLDHYIAAKLAVSDSRSIAEQQAIEKAIDELHALRKENSLGGMSLKEIINEGRKY